MNQTARQLREVRQAEVGEARRAAAEETRQAAVGETRRVIVEEARQAAAGNGSMGQGLALSMSISVSRYYLERVMDLKWSVSRTRGRKFPSAFRRWLLQRKTEKFWRKGICWAKRSWIYEEKQKGF